MADRARRKALRLAGASKALPQVALTSAGLQLQRDLNNKTVDPVLILRHRLAEGTADLETARLCLDSYYQRLIRVPRKQRRQRMQDDDIGSLALNWLWSEDHRWVRAVTLDVQSLKHVCLLSVAESSDDLLIEWLTKPLALADGESHDTDTHQWHGAVLRYVAEGCLMLDCDARADEAIRKFFGVVDRVVSARHEQRSSGIEPPLARTSLWPAQVVISRELATARYYRTNVELWDKFAQWSMHDGYQSGLASAKLAIAHPAKAELEPALSYVRRHLAPLSRCDFEKEFPTGSSSRSSMSLFLRRIKDVALQQNRAIDDDYVEQLMRTLLDGQERTSLEAKWQEQARWMKPAARRKEKRDKPVS
ncbi:hypothetical protein LTS10_007580 [Elasticomyces elasticus]|nr:hypothetical protein LTS10_007580 [Elasticomyces elasticus]